MTFAAGWLGLSVANPQFDRSEGSLRQVAGVEAEFSERSPQFRAFWGFAALDPSHPST